MFCLRLREAATLLCLGGWFHNRVNALNNGVSTLPPMGWSTWNAYGPAITEQVIKDTADAMVSSGMKEAGYQYINIDDMWAEMERNENGTLVANKQKFPSGMKALGDYIHSKGLKFGLYTDVGTSTCGGQPGSYKHECTDAGTFAGWGVDWLKEDHCSPVPSSSGNDLDWFYNKGIGRMRDCLNDTGRKVHFDICAHTCYDTLQKKHDPACWDQWYHNATMLGNSWRTTTDINPSWKSILNNWYRNDKFANALPLAQFNGPSHWNDPDSLEVGKGSRTLDMERLHFSMWCMMAAPLITGNILISMTEQTKSILTHKGLIAIDQDPMGIQAVRTQVFGAATNFTDVYGDPLTRWEQEVWAKPLLLHPGDYQQYGFALAFVNHGNASIKIEATMAAVAKVFPQYYDSTAKMDSLELWTNQGAGDVAGEAAVIDWVTSPSGVAVIHLDPDCEENT